VKPFRIWLSPPHLCGKEQEFVNEAFASNWIAPLGPHVDAFERELAAYVGVNHAAALSSGTAAIHLALLTLNIKPGDRVICSSFTFAGSCNPIAYCGAVPVFVDSEEETWNMSPKMLQDALETLRKEGTPAKAVILVELYGVPAQMEEIQNVCRDFRVPIIEDAAEALGSTYKGQQLGSFGAIGILSFNGNKIITTSGGGALLSNSEEVVARARFLATQARDPAPHYEHSEIGYNYRMSNMIAAVGRGQLTALDDRVKKRQDTYANYRKLLTKSITITFPPDASHARPNRWLSTILLPSFTARERVRNALAEVAIESRALWKPMHLQPIFRSARAFSDGCSESLFQRGLCLPSGSALTQEQISEVAEIVLRNG
jgi:dTDP-4-amino-4,6-dideoxygalactose transaminase